jgi:hypothetical protein
VTGAELSGDGALTLTVLPAPWLGGRVAGLNVKRGRLWVNPDAEPDEQLRAIAEAVQYLRIGDPGSGRRVRHLRLLLPNPGPR